MNLRARTLHLIATSGALALSCGVATAGVQDDLFIRGITWNGEVVDLNIATGAPTLVASGLPGGNSLTTMPDGSLTYIAKDRQSLVTIRPDGTGVAGVQTLDRDIDVRSLAASPDGILYAIGYEPGVFGNKLWTIDGVSRQVSEPIDLTRDGGIPLHGIQGAEFSPDGEFMAWAGSGAPLYIGLVSINSETGVVVDASPVPNNGALFQSITYAPDGRMFGVTQSSTSSVRSNSLFEIDPELGTFDLIGSFGQGFDIRGIAIIPSSGGLSVLAIGMGLSTRRRRA